MGRSISGFHFFDHLFPFQFLDGLLQDLDVHVESHGGNVPGLGVAQEVPAPRISRSCMAIFKPEPSSLTS